MSMRDQENWYELEAQKRSLEKDSKGGCNIFGFIFLIGLVVGLAQLFMFFAK